MPDVIVLDEVHERSVNIDMCIAQLARLLEEGKQPANQGKKVPKVVMMSATIDRKSLESPFRKRGLKIGQCRLVPM